MLPAQLLDQVGRELAEPLTRARDGVAALTTTGRLDLLALRELRESVSRARQAGIACQQIARLALGQVVPQPEPVALADALRAVLAQRQAESGAHRLPRESMAATASAPAATGASAQSLVVQADASLLQSLLQALLDACQEVALSTVTLELQPIDGEAAADGPDPRPVARLRCRFEPDPRRLPGNTLNWHLFDHLARCMGVAWSPESPSPGQTALTLLFSSHPAAPQPGHADQAG